MAEEQSQESLMEETVKQKSGKAGVGVVNGTPTLENDPELDALLDNSLSEFGKHVPKPDSKPRPPDHALPDMRPFGGEPSMHEFEEIFSEEFAKEAQTQLNEAVHMLAAENPELLKQFEEFTQSLENDFKKDSDHQLDHDHRHGDQPLEETSKGDAHAKATPTLDSILDETVRNIQQGSSEQTSREGDFTGMPPQLAELMSGLRLEEGGEEGEEQLSKVMEGMMNTLLSRDVLYAPLRDLCGQYPEWLHSHDDQLSPEDRARYTRQLDIMTVICGEFEGAEKGETPESKKRIMTLMQQLQECGQPPDDVGGSPLGQSGISSLLPSPQVPDQCCVM